MYQSYFKIGWRNLFKNKSYVIINTLGLGISLACCITAYLLLAFNIEFNNFHDDKKVANVFAIHTHSTEKDGRKVQDIQAPIMLGPIAVEEIAGVEKYCRYITGPVAMRYGDKAFNEDFTFADSTFFDLFDYPLIAGSHRSFKEKNSVFLNEEMAKKYFGDEDPIGKMLTANFVNEFEMQVVVGGVLKDVPLNNTFYFKSMMRIDNFIAANKLRMDDWSDWRNPSTYLELSSPERAAQIAKQFDKYIPVRNKFRKDVVVDSYSLEPFKAKFYQDDIRWQWVYTRLSSQPIIMFSSMGLLILLIACFNLTNTSIAMTAKRLKEVGVRKVVGATRTQLISQFLFETLLIISMSLVVGLLMAQWIVPAFYTMWGLPLAMKNLEGLNLFIALIILVFISSLLAGIYPALFSSKFKPTVLLKGGVRVNGTNPLTRMLVAGQFALSIIALIAGVIFIQNTKYQERVQFGYDKDMIITVATQGSREFEAMENAITSNPKILSVGVSDGNLGRNTYQTPILVDTAQYDVYTLGVGKNFFETMGIRLSEGHLFTEERVVDTLAVVIVNKTFVNRTKLKDPIGQVITLHGGRCTIVGVVEDHLDNLYRSKELEPFVFYPAGKSQYISLLVKTEPGDRAEIQKYLEARWKELFPAKPFDARYQEDLLLSGVREVNSNFEKIFLFITVLGGLLSSSGIFALASLNIARRTKEIGIRKALGASVSNIIGLLNKEFVIVLLVAAVLGSTGGYYATDYVLSAIYAYHIPVGMIPVFICSAAIFGIGIFTTSATILKAARSNPVHTLRND